MLFGFSSENYCRIRTAIKLHKNITNENDSNSKMKCRKHGLWVMRSSTVRKTTQELTFESARVIHTNIPYNTMLIYKLNRHLTKQARNSGWAESAAAGFTGECLRSLQAQPMSAMKFYDRPGR